MERTLRARLRAGDSAAFSELFDEHASAIYRHAARLTGDRTVAEDAVSLTFLEAWRLRKRLKPEEGSVLPWLFGLATNVIRNQARTARRHKAAMSRLPTRDLMPDFSDELIARFEDAELVVAARTALETLNDTDREIVMLCVWAGLDYAAAAEALGIPVGTVRSRLSRAKVRLRELTATMMQKENR